MNWRNRTHGLGTKTLSARLKELDTRGIVARNVEAGPPVRVQYALTSKGQAFGHVALAIETWGRELIAQEDTEDTSLPSKQKGKRAIGKP